MAFEREDFEESAERDVVPINPDFVAKLKSQFAPGDTKADTRAIYQMLQRPSQQLEQCLLAYSPPVIQESKVVSSDVNFNITDKQGTPCWYFAILEGNEAAMKFFVKFCINWGKKNSRGGLILMELAALNKFPDPISFRAILKTLTPSQINEEHAGESLFSLAFKRKNWEAVVALMEANADFSQAILELNCLQLAFFEIFKVAALRGSGTVVAKLLELNPKSPGLLLPSRDGSGDTLLMYAARKHTIFIQTLEHLINHFPKEKILPYLTLKNKNKCNAPEVFGRTPWHTRLYIREVNFENTWDPGALVARVGDVYKKLLVAGEKKTSALAHHSIAKSSAEETKATERRDESPVRDSEERANIMALGTAMF